MNKKSAQLYERGQVKEAIHILVSEIDQHPRQEDNYLQLSTYLLEQGSADQAAELLTKAKHLVAKPQLLDYNLAICYYYQGDFKKALALLSKLPNDDANLYQKGLVYLKLGQPAQGLAHVLSIKHPDDDTRELLGDLWLAQGDLKRAQDSLLQIPASQRSAKVWFLLGVSCLDRDRDQAEQYFVCSKKQDEHYFLRAKKQYDGLLRLINKKRGQA
jgi:tetratricopeptide (TPR) repeat protein